MRETISFASRTAGEMAENTRDAGAAADARSLYAVADADGDGRLSAGDQAVAMGDMARRGGAVTDLGDTADGPLTITAHGRTGDGAAGALDGGVMYSDRNGFGVSSHGDGFMDRPFLDDGDSLTFALNGDKVMKSVSFTAQARPFSWFDQTSALLFDFDGDVISEDASADAALSITVAKNAAIEIDFESRTFLVDGVAREGAEIDALFDAAGAAPQAVTIGGMGGAAFAIKDLEIDRADLFDENGQFVSAAMIHGDDGSVELGDGTTLHFHGMEDGAYVYGQERLVDDEKRSYDLSEADIAFLLKQAQLGVVAPEDLVDVSDARGIRLLSGEGNNVANPTWGKAVEPFARIMPASYADGVGVPNGGPNPRDVSNAILNQSTSDDPNLFGPFAGALDRDLPNGYGGNELVSAFGQYYDHGMDFVTKGGTNAEGVAAGVIAGIGNEGFPGLAITRGTPRDGTGLDGVAREHTNLVSPQIDQNQAYGSNEAILEFLLERDDEGALTARLLEGANGDLPTLRALIDNWNKGVAAGLAPAFDYDWVFDFRGTGEPLLIDFNPTLAMEEPGRPTQAELEAALDLHIVAGDGRVNENFGLTAVHTIWHGNHNYWADYIQTWFAENGGAPEGVTQKHIFDMAKIINEAEYQRAVFDEFVELMVGSDVHSFVDYNPNVNASITHEFAAAAFRLGHSMLNNYLTVEDPETGEMKQLPLFNAFLRPDQFDTVGGASSVVAGMVTSLHQEIDTQMTTVLRNNLVGRPLDLAAFNIARGRDLGLPTLNEMREMAGLSVYESWDDFAANLRYAEDLEKFRSVYDSVDDIGLWVGGLAEKPSSANGLGQNTVLGETFTWVFAVQQIALQDGDRFYYKHRLFETNLRQNVQSQDFSNVIERTLDLDYMHAEVFVTAERLDFRDVSRTQLELEGTAAPEVIIGRDIGEVIWGDGAMKGGMAFDLASLIANDAAETADAAEAAPEPAAEDGVAAKRAVDGDTIFAKAGKDIVIGGDTDDALHGGAGDDTLIGNDGDDRADGGSGDDVIVSGKGDDDIAGDEGDDLLYTGVGDDEAFGGDGADELHGGVGDDQLWGGRGDDRIFGGDGDDHLSGGEGDDVLEAGAGADIVIGSAGDDTLTGGAGADKFMFLPGSGRDVITDFSLAEDRIDLHYYAWDARETGGALTLADLSFEAVSGGAGFALNGGGFVTLEGVSRAELASVAESVFLFEDAVVAREDLVLSDDGLVLFG